MHNRDVQAQKFRDDAQNDDLDAVKKYIKDNNADADAINTADVLGRNAFILAAESGRNEIVRELLLVKGIDVNARGQFRDTALMSACQNGHTDTVKILLAARSTHGLDVNATNIANKSALMYAALSHIPATVAVLLNAPNIDLDVKCDRGLTIIERVSENGLSKSGVEIIGLLQKEASRRKYNIQEAAAIDNHSRMFARHEFEQRTRTLSADLVEPKTPYYSS
jgi:ankyrin repeat protein